MPKTVKAKSEVLEERDTIHPGFLTENFMNILEALGDAPPVMTFRKHIRDDVIWHKSRIPWKRSLFWLVLRVALQSALNLSFPDNDVMHIQYKNFMLFFISKITDFATAQITAPDILAIMKAKVGHRSRKMGASTMPFVSQSALDAVRAAELSLEASWKLIQNEEIIRIPSLTPSTTDDLVPLEQPRVPPGGTVTMHRTASVTAGTIPSSSARFIESVGIAEIQPDDLAELD